jgi:hypothetical protein
LAEGGDDLARGADTESRRQNREIEPRRTVLGEAIVASANWTNHADRIGHPVTQRIAAGTLLSAVGFLDEAAGARQPLKERNGCKRAQIGSSGTFAEGRSSPGLTGRHCHRRLMSSHASSDGPDALEFCFDPITL